MRCKGNWYQKITAQIFSLRLTHRAVNFQSRKHANRFGRSSRHVTQSDSDFSSTSFDFVIWLFTNPYIFVALQWHMETVEAVVYSSAILRHCSAPSGIAHDQNGCPSRLRSENVNSLPLKSDKHGKGRRGHSYLDSCCGSV